jgi:hypothetical protein
MLSIGEQEDHLCPNTEVLRRCMGSYQAEQFLALGLRERDLGWRGARHSDLLCPQNVGAQGVGPFYLNQVFGKRETFGSPGIPVVDHKRL